MLFHLYGKRVDLIVGDHLTSLRPFMLDDREGAGGQAKLAAGGVPRVLAIETSRDALSREQALEVGIASTYLRYLSDTSHSWIRNVGRPTAALFFNPELTLLPLFFSIIHIPSHHITHYPNKLVAKDE